MDWLVRAASPLRTPSSARVGRERREGGDDRWACLSAAKEGRARLAGPVGPKPKKRGVGGKENFSRIL